MIKTFKIIHAFYNSEAVCFLFKFNESAGTIGHPFKLLRKVSY